MFRPLTAAALFITSAVALVAAKPSAAKDEALMREAQVSLARATDYLTSISAEGGYLWVYSADLAQRAGEKEATKTQVWVQPPGTPTVGGTFLRAYSATGDKCFLEAARRAALALARGQLESGGWDYLIEFDPAQRAEYLYHADVLAGSAEKAGKRHNVTTFDDNNTQSALRFLLAFVDAAKAAPDEKVDAQIQQALDYGLKKLLEAQYPVGAWPQRWNGTAHDVATHPVAPASIDRDYPRTQPKTGYYGHYTLNDDCHRDALLTVYDAYLRTRRPEFLAALKRGIQFLVLAQLPEPQTAWAQQYDAGMHPAWARAFEPPSVCSAESAHAMRLLVDLYLETGDESCLKPIPAAIAWLKRSQLSPGRWARLYELETNRPIYGDRDGEIHYTEAEISSERQHGYGWEGDFGITEAIDYAEAVMAAGRDAWRSNHKSKLLEWEGQRAPKKVKPEEVRAVLASQDAQGRWLSPTSGYSHLQGSKQWVKMAIFIQRMNTLCDYLQM
jgi:hypothetical protein